MLILGCGNLDRSDDAAGLLLIQKLRDLGIDAHAHSADPLELIEAWSRASDVIVVDAVVSGAPPGTILEWDATADPLPSAEFRCSTHAFGIAEAVELARALDRLPAKLTILGIEARNFEPGGSVSAQVLDAVDRLGEKIKQLKF